MKFQMKLLSLAVMGLALSAPVAHAAIDAGAAGNGELFFSLWHDNGTATTGDDRSYTRDLGLTINTFAGATAPSAAATTASTSPVNFFGANTLLTSFLNAIPTGALVNWNVYGQDGAGARRVVSTAAVGSTGFSLVANTGSGTTNLTTSAATFLGAANTLANTQNATPSSSVVVNNSNTAVFGDGQAYAGGVAFGTTIGGRTTTDTTGAIGAQLPFFLVYQPTLSSNAPLTTQFTSANGVGADGSAAYWTLGANGDLSYNVNVAAVPEADTWAMFAAGLLAVGAIARRRLAA